MLDFKFLKPKPQKPKNKRIFINFSGLTIALNFKKGVKNFHLKVAKNTKISLSLPFYSTQKSAVEFLAKHEEWLKKTHSKILQNLPKDDEFILLGKIYKIKIDENLKGVTLNDDEILASSLKSVELYKKALAKKTFLKFIEIYKPIVNRQINKITVRKMQTRWGSCNSKKGYINLNLNLIEKEPNLIEYVVLHEMSHLIHPHHQKSFYDFLKSLMPDYKEREATLNGK